MSTAASSWATEPIQVLGRPTRASSPAGNQQKENFVARSATPIPIRLVILAARLGRLIHDPNKDAERCVKELDEAALIDGAGHMQMLLKIFIPVALPGIIAATIFAFTVSWAAFVYPIAFLFSAD